MNLKFIVFIISFTPLFFIAIFLSFFNIFQNPTIEQIFIMIFTYGLSILIVFLFFQPLKSKIIFLYGNPTNKKSFRAVFYEDVKEYQIIAPLRNKYFTDVAIFNLCNLTFYLFLCMIYDNYDNFSEILTMVFILDFIFLAIFTPGCLICIFFIFFSFYLFWNNLALSLMLFYIFSAIFYALLYTTKSLFTDEKDAYELAHRKKITGKPIGKFRLFIRKTGNGILSIFTFTIFISIINDFSNLLGFQFQLGLSAFTGNNGDNVAFGILDYLFAINKSILIIPVLLKIIQVGNFQDFFFSNKYYGKTSEEKEDMSRFFSIETQYAFVFVSIYVMLNIFLSFSTEFNYYLYSSNSIGYALLYQFSGIGNVIVDCVIIFYYIFSIKTRKKKTIKESFNFYEKIVESLETKNWVEF